MSYAQITWCIFGSIYSYNTFSSALHFVIYTSFIHNNETSFVLSTTVYKHSKTKWGCHRFISHVILKQDLKEKWCSVHGIWSLTQNQSTSENLSWDDDFHFCCSQCYRLMNRLKFHFIFSDFKLPINLVKNVKKFDDRH